MLFQASFDFLCERVSVDYFFLKLINKNLLFWSIKDNRARSEHLLRIYNSSLGSAH